MNWFSVGPALALPPRKCLPEKYSDCPQRFSPSQDSNLNDLSPVCGTGQKTVASWYTATGSCRPCTCFLFRRVLLYDESSCFSISKSSLFPRCLPPRRTKKCPEPRPSGRSGRFLFHIILLLVCVVSSPATDPGGQGAGQNAGLPADGSGESQSRQRQPWSNRHSGTRFSAPAHPSRARAGLPPCASPQPPGRRCRSLFQLRR